jgi:hypothetical protein
MSDGRDLYIRMRKCGRCKRPFRFAEATYVPGRYGSWTWPKLPVCGKCADELRDGSWESRGKTKP